MRWTDAFVAKIHRDILLQEALANSCRELADALRRAAADLDTSHGMCCDLPASIPPVSIDEALSTTRSACTRTADDLVSLVNILSDDGRRVIAAVLQVYTDNLLTRGARLEQVDRTIVADNKSLEPVHHFLGWWSRAYAGLVNNLDPEPAHIDLWTSIRWSERIANLYASDPQVYREPVILAAVVDGPNRALFAPIASSARAWFITAGWLRETLARVRGFSGN